MMLWYYYLSVAVITLLITLTKYMRKQDPSIPYWKAIGDFFVGDTLAEVKTIGMAVVVYLIGSMYIDKVTFLIGNELNNLPPHRAIAAFLGFAAEYLTPRGIQWVANLIFPWTNEP